MQRQNVYVCKNEKFYHNLFQLSDKCLPAFGWSKYTARFWLLDLDNYFHFLFQLSKSMPAEQIYFFISVEQKYAGRINFLLEIRMFLTFVSSREIHSFLFQLTQMDAGWTWFKSLFGGQFRKCFLTFTFLSWATMFECRSNFNYCRPLAGKFQILIISKITFISFFEICYGQWDCFFWNGANSHFRSRKRSFSEDLARKYFFLYDSTNVEFTLSKVFLPISCYGWLVLTSGFSFGEAP